MTGLADALPQDVEALQALILEPAPARLIEGGIPTEAMVAHVVVSKYADHLPLCRQAQIYADRGSSSIAPPCRTGPGQRPSCCGRCTSTC